MFNLKVYTMKRQRFFEGLGLKVYVTLAICMALLLNVQFLNAQSSTINVKGVVNDAMGPVIGASVVEKGNATNGTITDIDGNFSLKVPSDATLTISFIGYKTVELPVAGKTSFTVTLKEDSEILDEVVVVGFGTQKKVNLTGSVGLATAKEIEARPVANATQALQGLVPGLQITTNTGELDKNMSINIRGNGTIGDGSSGSPLILIDGMEGDINTVNPQDIETITVLKDASATAIYGVKAANGVIVITTKKGVVGRPVISYNGNLTLNTRPSYKNYHRMNSQERVLFSRQLIESNMNFGRVPKRQPHQVAYEQWTTKQIPQAAFEQKGDTFHRSNTDWLNLLFRSDVTHTHALNVSGGTEAVKYYVSEGYSNIEGAARGSDSEKFSALAKVDVEYNEYLGFTAKIDYATTSNTGYSSVVNPFDYAYSTTRTMPAYNEDGSYYMISIIIK